MNATLRTIVSSGTGGVAFDDADSLTARNLTFQKAIWVYLSPCVFIFGLIGNTLTVCVMMRRRYAGSSVRVYMIMLALSDSAVLLCAVPPEWLETVGYVTITHLHPIACKLERFLYYVTGDVAIWTLCAFTIDRFVAVCFPLLRRKRPRSPLGRLNSIACPLIVVLALAKNAHVAWTRGVEHKPVTRLCGYLADYAYFETYVRPWIVFVTVSIIPFCTLLFCNLAIVRALVLSERIRRSSVINQGGTGTGGGTSGAGSSAPTSSTSGGGASDGGFMQTSIMCVSVSFAFLVCMVPSIILYIGRPYWTSRDSPNQAYETAKVVNRLLVCVNHSISFWLYCLTGRNFRRELRAMFAFCPFVTNSNRRPSQPLQGHIQGKPGMTTNGTRRPPLRSSSVVCDRRPARASQASAAAAAAAGSSAGLDGSPHIRVDRSLSSPALGATTRRSSRRDVCDAANNRLFGTNHCHGEADTEYRRALVFASKPEPTPTVAFADNCVCPSSGSGSRPSRPSLKAPSSQGQGQRKTEIATNYNGNGPNTRPNPSPKWNELTTAVAAVMPTTKIITPDVKRSPSADDAAHLLQHPHHHHQHQQGGWQSIFASLPYIPYADDSDASGNSH